MDVSIGRRAFLRLAAVTATGAAAGALAAVGGARSAELPSSTRVRIGVVLPGTSGYRVIDAALHDVAADAARVAALLADSDVGRSADAAGHRYRMLVAHAPTATSAARAAQRLVELEDIDVLIGGIGTGHAAALAAVAGEAGVLFMNVGDPMDSLRHACEPHVFHVEPSNAMYLDALVDWHASQGRRRWFAVDDADVSGGIVERLRIAIERYGRGGELAGAAVVRTGQPLYVQEMAAADEGDADVVVAAVEVRDEIFLRHAVGDIGRRIAFAALPNPVTQTRDFIAASRVRAEHLPADHRLLAWETTLASTGAEDLNLRFTSRAGQPMDASGWTTYQAVRSFYEAVVDAGSTEPDAVAARLVDADRGLASPKGDGVSFRVWDHQLRQPLYVTEVDPAAMWDASLTRRIDIGRLAAVLPDTDVDGDLVERLDRYGDGPIGSGC